MNAVGRGVWNGGVLRLLTGVLRLAKLCCIIFSFLGGCFCVVGVLGGSCCFGLGMRLDGVSETRANQRVLRVEAVRLKIAGLDCEKGLILGDFAGRWA